MPKSNSEINPKFDMRVYTKNSLQYKMTSKLGCLVFPIFRAIQGVDPIEYVNSAFWAAHSFVVNSDIVNKNIPIYFYVEDVVYESLKQLFEDAHIPEQCTLVRSLTPKHWYGRIVSKKLHTVLDNYFEKYENVILLDCDTFLARTDTSLPLDIEKLWKRRDHSVFGSYYVRTKLDTTPPIFCQVSDMSYEEEYQAFRGITRLHLKKEIDLTYNMGGYINAFSPPYIRQDYKEFVEKNIPIFYNEEVLNSLYMQIYNRNIENLTETWKIPVASTDQGILESLLSRNSFFIHADPRKIIKSESIKNFRLCTGQDEI